MVRPRARRARGRGRRRRAAEDYGNDGDGILVAVYAPHRVEADADHVRVPIPTAVERRVCAALLLGERIPRLPRPGGRRHRVRVPGPGPRDGRHRVRVSLPAQAQNAHGHIRREHGRVSGRHRGIREDVRRRGEPAVRPRPGPGVHPVHVLQPAGNPAAALDTVRRGVSNGRQRYDILCSCYMRPLLNHRLCHRYRYFKRSCTDVGIFRDVSDHQNVSDDGVEFQCGNRLVDICRLLCGKHTLWNIYNARNEGKISGSNFIKIRNRKEKLDTCMNLFFFYFHVKQKNVYVY